MDIKKIILYTALAFIAFSLWNAWELDHKPKQQPTATEQQQTKAQQTTAKTPSDVPILTTQQKTVTAKIPTARIVHIKTDVLNMDIDTLGGNFVNASLPKYSAAVKTPNIPQQILSSNPDALYVAESGLFGINNNKPLQYKVTQKNYTLATGQKALQVNLTWKNQGFDITKSFKFTPGSYAVDVTYQIKNNSGKDWNGQVFNQIKRHEPKKTGGLFSIHTYDGAAIFHPSATGNYQKLSYSKMDKKNLNLKVFGGWVAMQQRYFLSAWVTDQTESHTYYSRVSDNKLYTIGTTNKIKVGNGQQQDYSMKLYVGPEIAANLKPLAKGLNLTIDYGWLWPISIGIFWLMQLIFKYIGNWGWAIVIVTLLIKLVFYKFSAAGYKASAKMRALAPKMKALKERYGGDKQQMSKATMELYKKEKINPISGCLPMLVQIPFFFALYYVLIEAVQLRHSPFIFWIHDLAARDPYFILPILMGISMFFTTKLSPTSLDPTQAKMMLLMPIVFTVLFASFPSGLVLYWLVNNLASLLQQWYILRKYSHAHARK